ncbi:MAG: 16S rRNA (cytosine(967)-C(5))-methyltransferase RsmB [Sedimenticolaceae bacterium]|nr:16S rRNA (cytosine(967)-C(5))-methyltransferase RsmB [Sedimenticolaceae bacterium]
MSASRSDARTVAARIVDGVMSGQSLDKALATHLPRLDLKERALASELSYGVCRWYPRLDAILGLMLDKPLKSSQQLVKALLLVGLYQLLEMRMPEHAAVSETVRAVKALRKEWARGLVNALLRRFIREREQLMTQIESIESARLDLPDWLLERIRRDWPDRHEQIATGWMQRPPMALRVNSSRTDRESYLAELVTAGLSAGPCGTVSSGLLLERASPVTELPGFNEGRVSVQDCGAQLAACLLAPRAGDLVLDACAAPGGKTAHLLELEPGARVIAADISEERLERVRENLERLALDAELVVADAAKAREVWAAESFDRILLDVPCSSTGVIRRHPDIRLLRRESDIAGLASLQGQILEACWPLLKPGGILLYATCSVIAEENQLQVSGFLELHDNAIERSLSAPGAVQLQAGIQLLPDDRATDGFYYALLEKRA